MNFNLGDPNFGNAKLYRNSSSPSLGDVITPIGAPEPTIYGFTCSERGPFVPPDYFRIVFSKNDFTVWFPVAPANYVVS